jgi:hypothetical protein
MNCQDISRALDSRDVNALSEAERRALDAHAASCPHCGPDWIVYTRLAAIPAPPMPQKLAAQCEALATAQLRGISARRRSSRTLLLGAILVVAAAAAVLLTRRIPPEAGAFVPAETPAIASSKRDVREKRVVPDGAARQPITVSVELIQMTDDSMGLNFGQQVYEHALQEVRALHGVVLIDARRDGTAMPAFRLTYTNASTTGKNFFLGPDGLPAHTAGKESDELLFLPSVRLDVEALHTGTDSKAYRIVPDAVVSGPIPRFVSGANPAPMPAECVGLRTDRCRTTPSDIAVRTILHWRMGIAVPDPVLEERLHAMLQASSNPELRFMVFHNLISHKQLRMDAGELRAVADLIMTTDDQALRAELVKASLSVGNAPDLMRQAQILLLTDKPNGDRVVGSLTRQYLVALVAKELRNEPAAQATLESVAASDLNFDVREDAKRALGAEPAR